MEPLSEAEPQLTASSYHGKSPSYQYKHQQSIPQMAPTATELNSPDLILPAASKGEYLHTCAKAVESHTCTSSEFDSFDLV